MSHDGVCLVQVPSLVDVELAASWPVWSVHPEGRPRSTNRLGKVCEMGDEQARVVSAMTLEPHTAPPSPIVVGAVDGNQDVLSWGSDQAGIKGGRLGFVVDESVCRVNSLPIAWPPLVKVGLSHRQSRSSSFHILP